MGASRRLSSPRRIRRAPAFAGHALLPPAMRPLALVWLAFCGFAGQALSLCACPGSRLGTLDGSFRLSSFVPTHAPLFDAYTPPPLPHPSRPFIAVIPLPRLSPPPPPNCYHLAYTSPVRISHVPPGPSTSTVLSKPGSVSLDLSLPYFPLTGIDKPSNPALSFVLDLTISPSPAAPPAPGLCVALVGDLSGPRGPGRCVCCACLCVCVCRVRASASLCAARYVVCVYAVFACVASVPARTSECACGPAGQFSPAVL